MIRYLRAFAWLRWRILLNGLKGSKRRDTLERISRVAGLLAPILLFVPFGAAAVILGILGFYAGRNLGTGDVDPRTVLLVARVILFLVIILPVLVPLGRAMQTSRSGASRLLLLPIPRGALHHAEAIATLADPWLGFVIPGLLLFSLGLFSAGRAGDGLVAFVASIALLVAVASLSALSSFTTEWVMRDRRRGEVFTLLFVFLISIVGLLPMYFSTRFEDRVEAGRHGKHGHTSVAQFDARLPAWSRAVPSELYGRSVQAQVAGRSDEAWLLVAALLAEAAAIYGLSSAVHRKVLDTSGTGRARRSATRMNAGPERWPFLTPAATAVATVHARNALRSVRGRLAVILPGPLFAGLALLARRIPDEVPFGERMSTQGYALLGFQCIFALYALQAFHLNQFASDRSGLSLHFLSPISDRDLLRGKAAGGAVIYGASLGLCFVCTWIVAPGGPTIAWLSVLLAAAATYAWLTPIAAALSALFPRTADLSKTGSGGNPHGLSVLAGTFAIPLLVTPPALVLGIVQDRLDRPVLALAMIAAWALLAIAISIPLLHPVASLVASRRENLALVAGGK
jgi:hypothetical protein